MKEQSLAERATINFKMLLGEEEMRELFVYLGRNLSSDVRYSIKRNEDISVRYGKENHIYPRLLSFDISGQITPGEYYRKKGCILAHFNCFGDFGSRHYDKIHGISFFVAPDYEICDVSEGEVELMDDTRKRVNEFIDMLEERMD